MQLNFAVRVANWKPRRSTRSTPCRRGLADEVEDVCLLLSEYPTIGRKADELHRSVPLRRFPFILFYRVRETAVQIVAVAHKRKRPGYWRRRR
jgi:plasmid stabilization system protein ParE